MIKLMVICFLMSLVFIAYGCGGNGSNNTSSVNSVTSPMTPSTPAKAPPQDDLAKGRELYINNCAECHKETGVGGLVEIDGKKIKADDLTSERRKKMTDEQMLKVMVQGIEDEGMPSFKDKLSEAEMREVVRYIRTDLQKQSTKPAGSNLSAQ